MRSVLEENKVISSASVVHFQHGSEPNSWDGMLNMAFLMPGMYSSEGGDACVICNRSASAHSKCIAIGECFAANHATCVTVGVLTLKRALWHPLRLG